MDESLAQAYALWHAYWLHTLFKNNPKTKQTKKCFIVDSKTKIRRRRKNLNIVFSKPASWLVPKMLEPPTLCWVKIVLMVQLVVRCWFCHKSIKILLDVSFHKIILILQQTHAPKISNYCISSRQRPMHFQS